MPRVAKQRVSSGFRESYKSLKRKINSSTAALVMRVRAHALAPEATEHFLNNSGRGNLER
jgi:hypothetical protein